MTHVDRYADLHAAHRWQVPERFNLFQACCARWAGEAGRVALYAEDADGRKAVHTYAGLFDAAVRLSAGLAALGVAAGERVAIVLPQRFETAVAYMAIARLGAVSTPLSVLFGPEALEYRLQDSGAVAAIVDGAALPALRELRARCPDLCHLIVVDESPAGTGETAWQALLAGSGAPPPADTRADDGAVLIYTSGTTGPPKGALIPQRAMFGNLTGFVASQNGFPRPGDVFWSPADWAWTGGLWDALLPTLYFGHPIVAWRGRFSPDTAFRLMAGYRVTNTFLFPTALKAMMKAWPRPREHFDLCLRAIMSAGEAVGDTVFEWCRDALGVTVNEMFGQTEINYIVGNSCEDWPARPGSMGRAYPGHRVAVIDDAGHPLPPGTPGEVAVNRCDRHGDPDPVFFLGYWNNPEATARKYSGGWCRTGDLAVQDEDGYLWYKGRADDVFKAAGYRIGPSEVENCLVGHPAVANAAVVPKPDPERGAVVKAFVVLAAGFAPGAELVAELQAHVRGRLAPYEYPKEIEFIDALPMTTTGKVQRRVLRRMEEERAGRR
ncbi:acyl-CoA synthetase [Pseudothauera rhizosphaerae]|uniref:AMP-binding protein n=1 Tax=Pseudothauera rhizosphaerae TaxID=2565932 RepID=A0A4S4ANR2_9RHOO|nr:AMP-binding protein [Pseudothauera rhizosphaerae]THF61285.1 AMP-binding protein [Pseudothauera rhizosphaerae]